MTCLVIAEHDNANLQPATLNAVAAATQISDDIHLMVIGVNCDSLAEKTTKVMGISN